MDVDRFEELLEEIEAGRQPEGTGQTADLLSVAEGLMNMAVPATIDPDVEDRIFMKMQALAPELATTDAYALEPELAMVASKLTELAPAVLTAAAEERIYDKIEAAMPVPAWSPLAAFKSKLSRVAAIVPMPVTQRRADAFAAMIDNAKSGARVDADGELGILLGAAMALEPLPAIAPSPSFVDWLEVRLTSRANAPAATATKSRSISGAFQRRGFQNALAGAAAALIAVAGVTLAKDTVVTPSGNTSVSAVRQPSSLINLESNVDTTLSPEPVLAAAVQAPAPSSRLSQINDPKGPIDTPTPPDDPRVPIAEAPPPPDDAVNVAAGDMREPVYRIQDALGPR